jgi:hypothetical protein
MTAEDLRLNEQSSPWHTWGPYLSDRQWGTVREDYSADGNAWDYFPHDQARSRAYRWGEDGIGGICDEAQRLCFALAFWNGEDPILKERFFGLTGTEGNHGEDVKEYYFYLDNTPTHSYMKMLYKYPHRAFPYDQLVAGNKDRNRREPELELLDTEVFSDNKYFDIFLEYAKADQEDILIKITVINQSTESKTLHILPTLWFRNEWAWNANLSKPRLKAQNGRIEAEHSTLSKYYLYYENATALLFTENETNTDRLFNIKNASPYVKDGINDYLVEQKRTAVNPAQEGTKASIHYQVELQGQEEITICLRLSSHDHISLPFNEDFNTIFNKRQQEADEFYARVIPASSCADLKNIQRQAFASLLWGKQYYYYVVEEWLNGDNGTPNPPKSRKKGRNREWIHLNTEDILSMPDKWEYPWFAAWDLAFHVIPFALIDPEFAKYQLDILTREWYMHPNGQIPAYEWSFSDVNPPVHAWAAWRVYQLEQKIYGRSDRQFLERVFQKLMLNFTWWVNRKDTEGNNVFQGGFLGLDNIGIFDRSAPLPIGGHIDQSDATSWMGMYCLNLLRIAIELAKTNPVYEDIATKFFEHFLYIADAMNRIGEEEIALWDEEDGFYYDVLHLTHHEQIKLKVRSMVGLVPLFAVETIEPDCLDNLKGFKQRLEWFISHRPNLRRNVACMEAKGIGARRLLAIASQDKLRKILTKMLNESEFLGDYGIRSVSKFHEAHPYTFAVNGTDFQVNYEPAESSSGLFGGNSNWRGPIWFPVNYLLIESLQKFHSYLGDDFKIEFPTGSGNFMNLQ